MDRDELVSLLVNRMLEQQAFLQESTAAIGSLAREIGELRSAVLLVLDNVKETRRDVTGRFPLLKKEDGTTVGVVKAFLAAPPRALAIVAFASVALAVAVGLGWLLYTMAKG
jgi:hypothetical protein